MAEYETKSDLIDVLEVKNDLTDKEYMRIEAEYNPII